MAIKTRVAVWKGEGFTLECDTETHFGVDNLGKIHGTTPCNHNGTQKLAILWRIATQPTDAEICAAAEASFDDRRAAVAMRYGCQ